MVFAGQTCSPDTAPLAPRITLSSIASVTRGGVPVEKTEKLKSFFSAGQLKSQSGTFSAKTPSHVFRAGIA